MDIFIMQVKSVNRHAKTQFFKYRFIMYVFYFRGFKNFFLMQMFERALDSDMRKKRI